MRERLALWCRSAAIRPDAEQLQQHFAGRRRPAEQIINHGDAAATIASRPAAVLMLLTREPDGLHVTLTRRTEHLPTHAGQISFPGGAIDPGDRSPRAAALREASEEVGLKPEQVQVLGELGRYYTVTRYGIHPVVAFSEASQSELCLTPEPGEVSEILNVPLNHLLNPANYEVGSSDYAGVRRHYYFCSWCGQHIWGATAGMLVGLHQELAGMRG